MTDPGYRTRLGAGYNPAAGSRILAERRMTVEHVNRAYTRLRVRLIVVTGVAAAVILELAVHA